ncbi:MAG: hypothetical protein C6P37_14155 [Caldibacillus debilis]|uniref:Uncharacterized protein n=1 Tax=Caldibacillus debilis TaxID=301148 RepID=A0A3E0K1D6_9BACI|nr:MAG: hypothetical protein BAA03_03320 [Caldibacillus debilis]REJ26156.1 MAG: hypothetical protein C6P37_14155 [Caldibacillus debilis]
MSPFCQTFPESGPPEGEDRPGIKAWPCLSEIRIRFPDARLNEGKAACVRNFLDAGRGFSGRREVFMQGKAVRPMSPSGRKT